jgi:tetratricopeptide (TPR) repeat protein
VNVLFQRCWVLISLFALGNGLGGAFCAAQDVFGSAPAKKSSFSDSLKGGFNKIGEFFVPKSQAGKSADLNDPTSLKSNAKPGPELYVAVARLYEQSGKFAEAEANYQKALKEKPGDLAALLNYGRMKEKLNESNAALMLYQQAVQRHPRAASAHNYLGLFYERQNKHQEAAREIAQAMQLDPRNLLYRNNCATVLVEQNRLAEAFAVMREVHGDAAAYYNLGYMLHKKGDLPAAEHHFAQALRVDPRMAAAQRWLNYLHHQDRRIQDREPQPQIREASRSGGRPTSQSLPVRPLSHPLRVPESSSPAVSPGGKSAPPTSSVVPINPPPRSDPPVHISPPADAPPKGSGWTPPQNYTPPIAAPLSATPPDPPELETPKRLPPISARGGKKLPPPDAAQVELTSHTETCPPETPTAPLPPE